MARHGFTHAAASALLSASQTGAQWLASVLLALSVNTAHAQSVAAVASPAAPPVGAPQVNRATLDYGLRVSTLPGGWHVIAGANDDFSQANGCNIINTAFIADGNATVVINTGVSHHYGRQQRAVIERTSGLPVREVWALNLHPDYFFGNQAFTDASLTATALTIEGARREGAAYADNLYRLCGDWMKGTESTPPTRVATAQEFRLTRPGVEAYELKGHTDSDLVIFDRTHGILLAGGLVFNQRVPTMPHARMRDWIESLTTLLALPVQIVVPSHGPVSTGKQAIVDTLDYLRWFDERMTASARQGLELSEVLRLPIPDRFKPWAAMPDEYARNVTSLYPVYEAQWLK